MDSLMRPQETLLSKLGAYSLETQMQSNSKKIKRNFREMFHKLQLWPAHRRIASPCLKISQCILLIHLVSRLTLRECSPVK